MTAPDALGYMPKPRTSAVPSLATFATFAESQLEPEPLRRPLPAAADYPLHALGPILGAAARRIHEVVQAPAALCGQSILAAASLAAQAIADLEIDGRRELLSLFALSVGDSGERKTGVDRHALAAHREHERAAFDQHRQALQAHEMDLAAHDTARKSISKGKKDAGAIRNALEELGPPPTAPLDPILIAPSPTLEGIHKLYAVGRPSLGLFHDDAGEFLGGHAMSEDNRMKSAAGLSRLWDAGEFDRIRAGDGAHKYFGRRLALHLMIQPVIAERVLSDDILTGQGLLARALLTWPTSTIGSRNYVAADLTKDTALATYRERMKALLERPMRFREGATNELEPRVIVLTTEARQLWIAAHDTIEGDQKDNGDFAGIRAWASKAPSQILRIAGILTVVEDPDAGVVKEGAIDRASLLVMHYLHEAARIVGTASVPADIRHAEALLNWCHATEIDHLHSGMALQKGPGCIRSASTFDRAIDVLERKGWAERLDPGAVVDGGRRRRAWNVRRLP